MTIWEKLRHKAPFLFLEPEKARVASFYSVFTELAKNLKTDGQIETYADEIVKGLDAWIAEHFQEETYNNIYAEENIIKKLIDLIELFNKQGNPVTEKVLETLRQYFEDMYKVDSKTKTLLPVKTQKDDEETNVSKANHTINHHGYEEEDDYSPAYS
jgi:hypothetical protein